MGGKPGTKNGITYKLIKPDPNCEFCVEIILFRQHCNFEIYDRDKILIYRGGKHYWEHIDGDKSQGNPDTIRANGPDNRPLITV